MKYSLQNLVEEYTRSSHYKPASLTPASYTSAAYTPSRYATSHYTPSQYTPTYTPRQSASKYSTASGYTSSLRASAGNTPTRRLLKPSRAVHFPNDILFQDHIRQGDMQQIGRFLRAQKVRVNKPFPSGE